MRGLMQRHSLQISTIIEHAAINHAGCPVLSIASDGAVDRRSYPEIQRRSKAAAQALLAVLTIELQRAA